MPANTTDPMARYPRTGDRGHIRINDVASVPIEVIQTSSPIPSYVLVKLGQGAEVWARKEDLELSERR